VLAGPRAGDSEAAALISGRGKRVMDSIRQEVAEFSHLQDAVAEQTDANFPATLRRMFLVLGVASALADRPSPPALGKNIPLAARLMAVADVYDALISRRVYKEPMDHQAAMEIMTRGRGTHFDPEVIDALLVIEGEFRAIAGRFCSPSELLAVAVPVQVALQAVQAPQWAGQ
jgi:hypothetical protein